MKTSKKAILSLLIASFATTLFAYEIQNSKVGDQLVIPNELTLNLVTKHQNFDLEDKETLDPDINSPKSVNVRPDGTKYYVNSLEGYATVVYDTKTHQKIKTILHKFTDNETNLWAPSSGLFPFHKYFENVNCFSGKPVESTFTHGGRYLWVPYYRRDFDINAQDPSALAVIDTETDEIIRLMETGPLPKMVTTSTNGDMLAVTHWGDNTVAIIDISGTDPSKWHYICCTPITKKLNLDFSTTESVNRDSNSGLLLRGTAFLPGDDYLLVSRMSGPGGIGVVDVKTHKYIGMLRGMLENTRHMVVKGKYLYLSCNIAGYVQRIPIDSIRKGIRSMKNMSATVKGWTTCKVSPGARTISLSPSGNYLFAACNTSCRLVVVDTRKMKVIGSITVDAFPVGLDVSPDGKWLITTSQGRKEGGGNSVNVFQITYAHPESEVSEMKPMPKDTIAANDSTSASSGLTSTIKGDSMITYAAIPVVLLALAGGAFFLSRRNKDQNA